MSAATPSRYQKGFAFSDTAFRIFILMASRRLRSDRFFTDSYKPETYTKEGLDWVADNTFSSVVVRHFPELSPALKGVGNAFWYVDQRGRLKEVTTALGAMTRRTKPALTTCFTAPCAPTGSPLPRPRRPIRNQRARMSPASLMSPAHPTDDADWQ